MGHKRDPNLWSAEEVVPSEKDILHLWNTIHLFKFPPVLTLLELVHKIELVKHKTD